MRLMIWTERWREKLEISRKFHVSLTIRYPDPFVNEHAHRNTA